MSLLRVESAHVEAFSVVEGKVTVRGCKRMPVQEIDADVRPTCVCGGWSGCTKERDVIQVHAVNGRQQADRLAAEAQATELRLYGLRVL